LNYLWCDLWEYRKEDLLGLDSGQLKKVLQVTEKHLSSYYKWRKEATNEMISILMHGLNLEDNYLMSRTLEAAFKLT